MLWLLAITIIFSIEIFFGLYWYKYVDLTTQFKTSDQAVFFSQQQSNYVKIYYWWFTFVSALFLGILLGWIFERKLRLLFKTNLLWQQKQPEFYRKTQGEIRVFLPWLIIELPILIIALINFVLLITFKSYTTNLLSSIFITIGLIIGQLIEVIREYFVIINMDRPEKPPKALIQKITPKFPVQYSLFIGQIYCRVFAPFFFLYILIFIPLQLIIFPNSNDKNLIILLLSLFTGVILRWFYDRYNHKSPFYFNKITIKNFIFTVVKLLLLLASIFLALFYTKNSYILASTAIICGFVVSWHPEKLRD
ncbi:MAG: hypothetical protein H7263_19145 [Candidatus Sericytochromatia bacterium]|nr:hypothetical protein [Candidatus Sericytochromatia bacterium]